MSILLGALMLALLLLPGILFRLGYLSLPFSGRSFKSAFLEELLFSLVPSFLLQAVGYWVVESFTGVRERMLLLLFLNSDKAALLPIGRADVLGFTAYALVLGGIAYGLGAGFRWISLRHKLHLRYSFLRIYSEWEIYFEGHILDYPGQAETRTHAAVSQRELDILVETREGSILYSGTLEKYVLTKDEKLDRLYLSNVRRRKLSDDARPASATAEDFVSATVDSAGTSTADAAAPVELPAIQGRYYIMPGNYFMIPGAEIRNIHITYYFKSGEQTGGTA